MEFEIKNLGLTIAVGGLAFGGIYLSLLLLEFNPFKLIPEGTGHGHKFLFSAIGLAIVFGAGVLLEGVTQSVTAGHGNEIGLPGFEQCFAALVDSDKALRFQIFFEVTNEPSLLDKSNAPEDVRGLQYKPFVQDLMQGATNDPLVWAYVSGLKARVGNCYFTNGYYQVVGKSNYDACVNLVNRIFYNAKNIVYLNDNYFSELSAIEMRKNFVLAMLFDFLFLAWAHLLLGLFFMGRKIYKKEPLKVRTWSPRRTLYIGFLAAYAWMFYCALLAYRVESSSYNSRVFGYYATLGVLKKENSPPETGTLISLPKHP